jgi:hypothetical protein
MRTVASRTIAPRTALPKQPPRVRGPLNFKKSVAGRDRRDLGSAVADAQLQRGVSSAVRDLRIPEAPSRGRSPFAGDVLRDR